MGESLPSWFGDLNEFHMAAYLPISKKTDAESNTLEQDQVDGWLLVLSFIFPSYFLVQEFGFVFIHRIGELGIANFLT
jgi:hypothetical protein